MDAAIVLVAHDRWFLEATTTAVLELDGGRSTYFPGPWHAWRREKAARALDAQKSAERVSVDIAAAGAVRGALPLQEDEGQAGAGEAHADRPARAGARAGGRRARAAEPQPARPRLRVPQAGAQRPHRARDGRARASPPARSSSSRRSPSRSSAGEHVGLVGPNGSGKTTLLETVLGRREPARRQDAARPRRRCRLLLAARDRARRAADRARDGAARDRALAPAGAEPARPLPLLGLGGAPEAGLRALRAASGGGWRSRGRGRLGRELPRARRAHEPPRPREPRGARGRARGVPGHACCSSRTTARCSTRSPSGRSRSRSGTVRSYDGGWAEYAARSDEAARRRGRRPIRCQAPSRKRHESRAKGRRPRRPSELERLEAEIAAQEEAIAALEQRLAEDWADVDAVAAHKHARDQLEALLARWEQLFEASQAQPQA